jgi:hypothetical protein
MSAAPEILALDGDPARCRDALVASLTATVETLTQPAVTSRAKVSKTST